MNYDALEALLDYIHYKVEYVLALREPGTDGYYTSCVTERKDMEAALKRLKEVWGVNA